MRKTNNMFPPLKRGLRSGLFFLFNLLLALPLWGQGGTFPVQVIPQVTPPPPIYFADYADASTVSSPLRVQIILNDFEIANREIRLRTYFEGGGIAFQSNDVVIGASPLFLEGGVPLVLTNVELAPYFRYENISGISPNVYGQAIPEGAYTFCFEVYDVLTGSRISQRSCATSVVFQNEPPFLISPRNKTNVQEINPQNIVFQWTPRHINVTNVEYELSIVEIWDTQVDPQQAFLSSPPVFQTTTTATTYVYGPADPLFLSGKNYAWRIQAKAKQGIEEIGLFENQGYSEIFSFSYAGSCDLPIGMDHEVKGSTNANIFWDDFSTDIPEYTVRYRKKSPSAPSGSPSGGGNEWFYNKTTTNQTTLWDLKAGTVYEYQVQKKCAITESDWSISKQFTTFIADDEASVYECGITPDFNLTNKDPLPNISTGEKFTAGDFPIIILEVSGSGGRFTGKGYVTIPYLNSIKVGVEFTNVLINTDNRLAEGTVTTMYDPNLQNILDIDDAIDTVEDVVDSTGEFFEGDNDLDEIKVDWKITKEDITIEDGMVVITNPYNGVTTSEPLGDDMTVVDSAGNTYYVDEDGQVSTAGATDNVGAVTEGNVEGVSSNGELESLTAKGILVTFNKKGTYGMDTMPTGNIGNLEKEYTIIKDSDGKDYPLTHHAVIKQGSTQIKAEIILQNNTYAASDIVFKNKQGELIPHTLNGTTATLTVVGRFTFENETIYAVVPNKEDSTKQLTAGAFTLWHLTERKINVAIVTVGASVGDVQNTVTNIFKNSIATVNFKETITLDPSEVQDLLGNNVMDVGDSPFTAAYNQEQKALRNLARAKGANDSDTYYIIVLGEAFTNTKGIAGFMPLQRQFGFVFERHVRSDNEGKGDLAKTVAHELGHGVFALQHPFTQYGSSREATDWLMSYNDSPEAKHLPHVHWAQIHNPDLKFYVFQDESEGEIAGKIWFTPDWRPFQVDNTSIILGFNLGADFKGAIPGFRNALGIDYRAEIKEGKFTGIYLDSDGNPANLIYPNVNKGDGVYFYEHGGCGNNKRLEYAYNNSYTDYSDYVSRGTILSTKTYSCNELCSEGKSFFDEYSYLLKNDSQKEKDALNNIAQLICSEGTDGIDYNILVAQLSKNATDTKSKYWWGRDKYLFDLASEIFWNRDNAFQLYFEALISVKNNISKLNEVLESSASKEEYYNAIYYWDDAVLNALPSEAKVKILTYIFEEDTFITSGLFNISNDDESLLLKVINSVNENRAEAKKFLEELSGVTELYEDLQSGLDDHLDNKNYTNFILKLSKLAEIAYADGDSTSASPKMTLTWGIKNVDFVLKWVVAFNDFRFDFQNNSVYVTGGCSVTENRFQRVGETEPLENIDCEYNRVPLNPFSDFVQVTVIENVGMLPTLCNNQEAQLCGKAIVVPAFFLDYLQTKKETQQLENFGWNVFTVAGTILTGGELAAAKVGSAVWWWAATDLAYTFSTPVTKIFREDLEKATSKEFSDNFYKGWDAIQLIFAAKGVNDLLKANMSDVAKGIATKEVLGENEFYKALGNSIRKENPGFTDAQVLERVEETKEVMGQIESEVTPEILDNEIENARRLLGGATSSIAGTVSKSSKALIIDGLPNPAGLFRQFSITIGEQVKNLRAANFSKKIDNTFNHFIDRTGKYYIKHNPNTGELLLIDAVDKKFLGYAIDEFHDSKRLIESSTVDEFEILLSKWGTLKGLDKTNEVIIQGRKIKLPKDKVTIILGKYEIFNNPNNYLTTEIVLQELGLNHLKYWELSKNILPSSHKIHMLNVPRNVFVKDTWWTSYNAQLIEDITKNPSKYNVVILTDVVKSNYLDELKLLGGVYEEEILELGKHFEFIAKDDFWSIKKK